MDEHDQPLDGPQSEEQETRVRNDFLFEWFQKFHGNHRVLRIIYKFNKNDCLFNLRYLAMVMHLAAPAEFEPIIAPNSEEEGFEGMGEQQIRELWSLSYEEADTETINIQFLSSLKAFFQEKGLATSPLLKQIFQRAQAKEKAV